MMTEDTPKDEIERRWEVAQTKAYGALIEAIERMRKRPVAYSITLRLFSLDQHVRGFIPVVKLMAENIDPLYTVVPSFTRDQANLLVRTYNDIITDLHSNFEKKDSYVKRFSELKELEEPTLDEVVKTLYMIGLNTSQIMFYMIRWAQ